MTSFLRRRLSHCRRSPSPPRRRRRTGPGRPCGWTVPFAADGPSDLTAGVVADELGRQLRQPMIVETRTGAGSAPGSAFVAAAPRDGHTILFTTPSLAFTKSLVAKLPFHPQADLVPAALVGTSSVLVANNDFPARTLPEVIALLRRNPGKP